MHQICCAPAGLGHGSVCSEDTFPQDKDDSGAIFDWEKFNDWYFIQDYCDCDTIFFFKEQSDLLIPGSADGSH
jgi:hypothetical protein